MTDRKLPRLNLRRSGERLQKLAYEMEWLSSRLRDNGEDLNANGLRQIASRLGNIGRELVRTGSPAWRPSPSE